MRVLSTELSKKECMGRFHQQLDSRLLIGLPRFTGWTFLSLFSVSYYSGKEFLRHHYPIHNKAVGIISTKEEKTLIRFWLFKGLTDPVSLFLIWLFTGIIFAFAGSRINISPGACFGFALIWTAIVSVTTFLFTFLSDTGMENESELENFISEVFELHQ